LVTEHNYTYDALDAMSPFEFELQTVLVLEHLEKLKKLKRLGRLGA